MQLLVYLLPPCDSDTLQRLLHFLATVAAHAHDGHDRDRQEVRAHCTAEQEYVVLSQGRQKSPSCVCVFVCVYLCVCVCVC